MMTSQKNPAFIFDFGGVLVDWSPYFLYRKILNNDEEIKAFLDEIDFWVWNPEFDRGLPFEQGVAQKIAQFPQRAELIRIFQTRWMETMGPVRAETVEVLRRLKEVGYPLYGLSNWSVTTFEWVKQDFYFLEYLDDYLLSGQVQQVKPEPAIFAILLQKIDKKADDCVFIDDHLPNIIAARALGFGGIHFQSAEQLAGELKEMGIFS